MCAQSGTATTKTGAFRHVTFRLSVQIGRVEKKNETDTHQTHPERKINFISGNIRPQRAERNQIFHFDVLLPK
jgi:hypothetical protein